MKLEVADNHQGLEIVLVDGTKHVIFLEVMTEGVLANVVMRAIAVEAKVMTNLPETGGNLLVL